MTSKRSSLTVAIQMQAVTVDVIVYWFSVTLSFGESLVVSNEAD